MRNPASFCAAKSKSSKKPNRATNDQKATRAASRPAHFFSQGKAAFLFILLFAGCAQYTAVSEKRPRFTPVRSTADALVQIQQGIAEALKKQSRDPMAALGSYLASADAAARELARNPQNDTARSDYNFAVARIISTIRDGKLDPWTQPLRVPAEGGDYVLDHRRDRRKAWNPALYRLTPADQFGMKGTYVSHHSTKEGVGAPLVAVGVEQKSRRPKNLQPAANLLRHHGSRAILRAPLHDCLRGSPGERDHHLGRQDVPAGGRLHRSAGGHAGEHKAEEPGDYHESFSPEKYAATARLARLQPYDPNKTVVLVIHGLADTPATWTPMLNTLRSDESIRRNYQFWFYSYPSGYPYPYSAALLRPNSTASKSSIRSANRWS